MAVITPPGFDLQPSGQQVALATNYITDFDFLNQYLPDTSDLIKWAEQGRLHTKYTGCTTTAVATDDIATWTIPTAQVNPASPPASSAPANGFTAIRVGQTIMISDETAGSTLSNKAIVTSVDVAAGPIYTIDVAYYEGGGQTMGAATDCTIFIYGSEFKKGQE